MLVISISLIIGMPQHANAAESGKPDPTPTPIVSCGGLECSYFAGKYFAFASVDIKSQAQIGDIGQFPCQVNQLTGTDFCRVFPKNALQSNNLTKMVLKGGFVEITQAVSCDAVSENSCKKIPLPALKLVLTGSKAAFDQYPFSGFTFSDDRKTLFIEKEATLSQDHPLPGILVKEAGGVTVTAYLAIGDGNYSTDPSEAGRILVKSNNDNFIFQDLRRKDLKKNPKIVIKPMQKEITCVKGKISRKLLKTNIYDSSCPPGFKNK